MIGRIKGTLAARDVATVLIDVAGIGYELEVTAAVHASLPAVGETVTIHTHLVVREDAHILFGFATAGERDLFRSLIKVAGIGPKLALTLLSGMEAREFARCIREGDAVCLTALPGIGRKTADRVILELKDRIDEMMPAPPSAPRSRGASSGAAAAAAEAEQALVALGYRPVDASRAVVGVYEAGRSAAELVRAALKRIGAGDGART
jgi:Holliday junction DNA helicase RuvA